jgi:hypothetical protein
MTKSFPGLPRLERSWVILLLCAGVILTAAGEARSQEFRARQPIADEGLDPGAFLFHGNYCGLGGRPGTPPVDALDAACMRHDACTSDTYNGLASCACNERFRHEVEALAQHPAQPPDIQFVASLAAVGTTFMLCHPDLQAPGEPIGAGDRLITNGAPAIESPRLKRSRKARARL